MSADSAILAKYRYRRRLPHLQKADADLFITFCTGARQILRADARDLVFQHCLREGGILPFAGEGARATLTQPRIHLHPVVIMPDHVHLLLRPLRDENVWPFPVMDILKCFKGSTAHRINKLLGSSGRVWEEESFDHVLRSDESLKEKAEYIRQNPVAAGLVRRPRIIGGYGSILKRKSSMAGEGARPTYPNLLQKKEKANQISLTGLYFMPATTYSPTHFRVQYNRPCGA